MCISANSPETPARWRLILASASPRRRDLLRSIGLSPVARPSRLSEIVHAREAPDEMVCRLAAAKGRRVASAVAGDGVPSVVLGADTAVVVDDVVLGKPADATDAARMLAHLRGRVHEVITGVFLLRTDDGRAVCEAETTRVTFRDYDDDTIRVYVESEEPLDKAGAYAIQGLGAQLAERIDGSWSNVVGLPVERLPDWLARIGIDLEELRTAAPRGR